MLTVWIYQPLLKCTRLEKLSTKNWMNISCMIEQVLFYFIKEIKFAKVDTTQPIASTGDVLIWQQLT